MEAATRVIPHIDDSRERPVIAGTDIKVSQIASESEHLGMTPDEIVEAHPHLTLADIHAALMYYFDHQAAIRAEWKRSREIIAEVRATHPGRFPSPKA